MATFTNQATLTYNNIVTNSNIVTGEIIGSITAQKNSLSSSYSAGSSATFIISLINTSGSAVTGVSIEDDLGAYAFSAGTLVPLTYKEGSILYYLNGILQAAPGVTSGSSLTISGISLPAGGSAVIIYSADVNSYAPISNGSTIVNTASITAAGVSTPVSASNTITAANEAKLSISKAISPSTITENSEITYTFTIYNYGSLAVLADDDAVITDTFDPALSSISVSFNGEAWAAPTNYTYDQTTGVFSTSAGELTVPAAAYSQNSETGEWSVNPGSAVLKVAGRIS